MITTNLAYFLQTAKPEILITFVLLQHPARKAQKAKRLATKIPRVSTFESLGLSWHAFSNFKQMQFVASAEPAHGLTELFSVQAVLSWHSHCTTQSTWIDNTGFRSITWYSVGGLLQTEKLHSAMEANLQQTIKPESSPFSGTSHCRDTLESLQNLGHRSLLAQT